MSKMSMTQAFLFRCGLCASLLMVGFASVAAADGTVAHAVQQIVAHRGSSADRPENTVASTLRAIEAGATAVEVDVRRTKDGSLVLSHDSRLDRTTNGTGRIRDRPLAEIQRFDAGRKFNSRFAGERVPTLEQVLALCRGKIDVLLDLKESGEEYDRKVADTVLRSGEPERTIVGVRSPQHARTFRALLPTSRQLGLIDDPDEIDAYAAAGVEMIRLWPRWLNDKNVVSSVRQHGLKIHVNGTTGTAQEITPLLEYRPESLSTDDPARLVATLAALGR
jgi:glycerophosphoryl diester phosphodiesterase